MSVLHDKPTQPTLYEGGDFSQWFDYVYSTSAAAGTHLIGDDDNFENDLAEWLGKSAVDGGVAPASGSTHEETMSV